MPGATGRAAAFLTACFGVGQVIGPIVAGVLADLQQGFGLSLMLAAAAVLVGAVFLMIDREFQVSRS
jgi:MFS family permease